MSTSCSRNWRTNSSRVVAVTASKFRSDFWRLLRQILIVGIVVDHQEAQRRFRIRQILLGRESDIGASFGMDPIRQMRCSGAAIEQKPVHAELLDDVLEFGEVHRLLNVAVHAELVALHQICFLLRGGEGDDGNRSRTRIAFHFLR